MSDVTAARTTSTAVDAVIQPHDGLYFGYVVTTAMSAAASNVYDHASAASGTIIDVIPASSAVGAKSSLQFPIRVKNGIYIDIGGTGTVTVLHA
jgi:hypothetical protein